jgi:hypothetical protein
MGEKVVNALRKLKCPHPLQSHQIQGLDFVSIFPVVQWLVKKVLEVREEMGDSVRRYSDFVFSEDFSIPEEREAELRHVSCSASLSRVRSQFARRRLYRRTAKEAEDVDEKTSVRSTLLEFGENLRAVVKERRTKKTKKGGIASTLEQKLGGGTEADEGMDAGDDEGMDVGLDEINGEETRLSSASVGRIIGLQSQEIRDYSLEYDERAKRIANDERASATAIHEKKVKQLDKKIAKREEKRDQIQAIVASGDTQLEEMRSKLEVARKKNSAFQEAIQQYGEVFKEEDPEVFEKLRDLLLFTDELGKQEEEFKQNCVVEHQKWKNLVSQTEERVGQLEQHGGEEFEAVRVSEEEKKDAALRRLGDVSRKIAIVEREMDVVPSRGELMQYQKRFAELYDQVLAKLEETRKYYNTYNTLEETRKFLERELTLLNSIHDNFKDAMQAKATKEKFMESLSHIVQSVKQSKDAVKERLKNEYHMKSEFESKHQVLVEQQRQYYKAIKELQEEMLENERLRQLSSEKRVESE